MMNGQPINLMGISPRSKVNLYLEDSPISIFIMGQYNIQC